MFIAVCDQCNVEFEARIRRHKRCSPGCRKKYSKINSRQHYLANRDGALIKQKRYFDTWKENNPGKYYYGTEYRLYYGARDRCKKSGLEFTIKVEDIIVPVICPILGIEMVRGGRYAPSIDRRDSNIGYTPENIWVISKLANRMKNDASPEEIGRFAEWAKTFQPS